MPAKAEVLTGRRFSRLLVGRRMGNHPVTKSAMWECRCDCGNVVVLPAIQLRRKTQKSCGCFRRSFRPTLRHGHAPRLRWSRTYKTWASMQWRVKSGQPQNAPYYRDKGITVCERWSDFAAFLEDMGERPAGMTLDRIDNSKGYEPGNCRWATWSEQNRNKGR